MRFTEKGSRDSKKAPFRGLHLPDPAFFLRSCTDSRSEQIGEQIFCMPTPKKCRALTGTSATPNTWCISSFFGKGRRKICRQDACGGYWDGFLLHQRRRQGPQLFQSAGLDVAHDNRVLHQGGEGLEKLVHLPVIKAEHRQSPPFGWNFCRQTSRFTRSDAVRR